MRRSTATAGSVQSTWASSTEILGASERPSGCCSRASRVPSSIPSRVWTSRPAPPSASRASRSPAVSRGPDGLRHHAVRRTGVELAHETERGRSGHLVARPDRVLHGRRAAPRREHREVQVHPAVGRDVQRRLRHQGAVRDDRAAVGREVAQRRLEVGLGRSGRLEHRDAQLLRALGHRGGDHLAAAAGRSIGAGDHADELVPAGGHRVERQHGRRRGACEDEPHLETQSVGGVRRDLHLGRGVAVPLP